jgi:MoxR-like ATPase
VPGTAKSWVSEHLAAAVTGDSTLVIQCTAGTDENQVRYGWNYALLLANGPEPDALVPTPLMRAMEGGKLCRFEELTRMGSDVQDTLITVLSEKMMPIPELNTSIYAQRGFNIIATANNRDKGVNELSSALKRRFNVVVLPLPDSADQEVAIVVKRVGEMAQSLDLPAPKNVAEEVGAGGRDLPRIALRARPRTARWRLKSLRAGFRPPRRSRSWSAASARRPSSTTASSRRRCSPAT